MIALATKTPLPLFIALFLALFVPASISTCDVMRNKHHKYRYALSFYIFMCIMIVWLIISRCCYDFLSHDSIAFEIIMKLHYGFLGVLAFLMVRLYRKRRRMGNLSPEQIAIVRFGSVGLVIILVCAITIFVLVKMGIIFKN